MVNKALLIFILLSITACQGDQLLLEKQRVQEEKNERIEAEKEKNRLNTLNLYLTKASNEEAINNYKTEMLYLDSALKFSLVQDQNDIFFKQGKAQYKLKKYNEAILKFDKLIKEDFKTSNTLYERALCFIGLRNTQEAVNDLRKSMEMGNSESKLLFEKINPLKKRIAYYVTRCCDGTTSDATGRGACSHHDGVCDWNEPVYEEYRKY